MQTFVPITVILTVVLKHWACWYVLPFFSPPFFLFLMVAKEVIHCLKPVSLLEPFLLHFLCPLTSDICHSNTSAQSRGEGEWLHQKQMPKCSLGGLGQSDHHSQLQYNLTAVLEYSPTPRGPRTVQWWFWWLVCLPHCRKCWWEVNHTSLKGQILPCNLYPVTAIAFYKAKRRPIFLIASCHLFFRSSLFFNRHHCITETEVIFANSSSEKRK